MRLAGDGEEAEEAPEETNSGRFRPGGRLSRSKRRRRMARRQRPGAAGLTQRRGPYGHASGVDRGLGDTDDATSEGVLWTHVWLEILCANRGCFGTWGSQLLKRAFKRKSVRMYFP